MADFNQLVQDVITITNRPDLVAETQLAVKSATLQLHRQDFFYKDIFEAAIKFDKKGYLQAIEYRKLFPRYRALKYLRKYYPDSATSNSVGPLMTIVTPEQIMDGYGADRTDIVYGAGELLQVKSSTEIEYALMGVYRNPEVSTPELYSSWVADEAPFAVIYQAASIVFGTSLRDSKGQNANAEQAAMEFQQVKNSNILAQGY